MAGYGIFFNTGYSGSGNRHPDAKVYNASNVYDIYFVNSGWHDNGSDCASIRGSVSGTHYSSRRVGHQFAPDAECDFYDFST
ncbi:hypothetical protein D3C78_1626720 [compost metagenome]